MRAYAAMVLVTLRQLLGGKRLIILGLLGVLPAFVTWLTTANRQPAQVFADYNENAVPMIFLIVLPIAALVLGAAALGDERRDHTLSFLLVRPLRRSTITGAKLTAAWIAAAGFTAAAGAAASAAASVRSSDWSTLVPTMVGTAIAAACYAAVFMVLGHLTSRAVLIGLVYVFIWESGISLAAPSLANVSLFRIGLTAYAGLLPESRPFLAEPLGSLAPGAGGALVKTVAIGAIAVLAAASLLKRRDTT